MAQYDENGMLPKRDSMMYKAGQTNYSTRFKEAHSRPQQQTQPTSPPPVQVEGGWFKAFFGPVVKAALKKAYTQIIKPTAKRFANDVFEDVKNQILWRDSYPPAQSPYRLVNNTQPPWEQPEPMTKEDHDHHNYTKLRAKTPEEATRILTALYSKLRREGQVTLAFYYECFNEKRSFADENWGWRDMTGADAEQTPKGWKIIMPKLQAL